MALDRMRIFISSPGDVAEERVLANNLVRRLADEFAQRLWIEPVFWEHEPLLATETFQSQIPPPRECEVAVCILWSRLGTRLPANITRVDGSRYGSGTEYEFEDAAEGFRSNGRPQLLVYRKTADPVMSLSDKSALMRRLEQKEALDLFVQKWFFHAEDGTLKAAFHCFANAAEFETTLEEHLRKLIARRLENLPAASADAAPGKISWTSGSPFRGLEVFDFQHAPVFFGRTQAIGDVLSALRQNAATGRAFVLVVGVSGGGKSSLVRAGVLPVLTQPGVIEGVGLWRRAVLKPSDGGGNLMQGVALALLAKEALPELSSDGTTPTQLAEQLKQNPAAASMLIKGGLSQAAAKLAAEQKLSQQPDGRLVLVLDQLEELFTLPNVTLPERQAFVALLSSLARSGKVFIIATLRGDFYHRCFELPELGTLKEGAGHYDLPLPSAAEIAQMIRQPARAAGLAFEEDPQTRVPLDEVLREAASRSPESLPLLEFALEEIYRRKTPQGVLTYAAYRELGGVEGALAKRAEEVFNALEPAVRATLPRVMRALVSVGDGEALARQQASMESVASTPHTQTFVEAFVQARLFTADRAQTGQAMVRVTHEALLRNWPRLSEWLAHNKELLLARTRVVSAAARWAREDRQHDLLLPEGLLLEEGRQVRDALGGDLTAPESEFIALSERKSLRAKRLRARDHAALVRSEATAQRNAYDAHLLLADGLVSHGDVLRLAERWGEAKHDYWEAYASFVDLHASPFRAEVGLAIVHGASPPALFALAGPGQVESVALSPDGRTALSGSRDKTLKLWDLATGQEIRTFSGHTNIVYSVAFSPDGRSALSGSADETLKLWDLATGREIRTLSGHTNHVTSVAFSPDSHSALSGSDDHTLKLWNLATGTEIRTLSGHSRGVLRVAISPDSRSALSGSQDNTLKLWDLATGTEIRTLSGGCGPVAFSPDGRTALSGGADKTLKLWDLASGKEIQTLIGHKNVVFSVAFSLDGRTGLSGSHDRTLKLWDLATGKEIKTLVDHVYGIYRVAFSPDGRTALSPSGGGSMKLCSLTTGKEIRTLAGHRGNINSVAFSPDGRTALSGSDYNALKFWDLATGKEIRTIAGHSAYVSSVAEPVAASEGWRESAERYAGHVCSVAFSPDGRTALSGSCDYTLKLWDLATGQEIRTLSGHAREVTSVAFSPDGRTALSGGDDETLKLWDLATGKEIRTLTGHTGYVMSVAFSPDGRWALSGSSDKTLKLWDLATGKEIRTLTGHKEVVSSVAFSPDGRSALSGSWDNMLKLWDLTTGKEIRTLSGHTRDVASVAFSSDGHWAISGSDDHTLKFWDLATGKEIQTLTGHTGRVLSVAFSPNGRSALSGSDDHAVKIWDFSRASLYLDFETKVPQAQTMLQKNPDDAAALAVLGEWCAFRGVNHWAVEFLEKARAGGVTVNPLTLAQCYWELSDDLPLGSKLTRATCLAAASREFKLCLTASHDAQERFHLQLCLAAIQTATTQPAATQPAVPVADTQPAIPVTATHPAATAPHSGPPRR